MLASLEDYWLPVCGALSSLAGNVDSHRRIAGADLLHRRRKGMKLGRPTGPGKSKLDPYRPEIEGLLANDSTQKCRYRTTEANLHNWLKKARI
jgi:hypothetical protein